MRTVVVSVCLFFFFFKQKTAYEILRSDWSSDVCSSDLAAVLDVDPGHFPVVARGERPFFGSPGTCGHGHGRGAERRNADCFSYLSHHFSPLERAGTARFPGGKYHRLHRKRSPHRRRRPRWRSVGITRQPGIDVTIQHGVDPRAGGLGIEALCGGAVRQREHRHDQTSAVGLLRDADGVVAPENLAPGLPHLPPERGGALPVALAGGPVVIRYALVAIDAGLTGQGIRGNDAVPLRLQRDLAIVLFVLPAVRKDGVPVGADQDVVVVAHAEFAARQRAPGLGALPERIARRVHPGAEGFVAR